VPDHGRDARCQGRDNCRDGQRWHDFTLVVPPDALLVSQRISLTPVQTIVGLPYHGGLSAAVHLEPDGLTLFKPATLTIRGNKPAPAGYAHIGFEYQGSGTGLHFYPTQQ
jgi:hypothetical protein